MYAVSFIKTIRMWCKNKVKTVSNGLYPLTYICYAGEEKIIKLMQKIDKLLSRVLAHDNNNNPNRNRNKNMTIVRSLNKTWEADYI